MLQKIIASQFKYSREEALSLIKSREWYKNSSKAIKDLIENVPEEFEGFLNDLADRKDQNEFYVIRSLRDIFWSERYALPVFDVISAKDGLSYVNSYVSWRKGIYYSLRGLILVAEKGEISYFIVKKSFRFAVDREVYEAIGGIHPLRNVDEDSQAYQLYLQTELGKILRIPKVTVSRTIDLGKVYPDASISDTFTKLFVTQIEVDSVNELTPFIENKSYIDKRYDYSFEVIPIEKLLRFLAETNDSFLLAIFGRLQALNVVKL